MLHYKEMSSIICHAMEVWFEVSLLSRFFFNIYKLASKIIATTVHISSFVARKKIYLLSGTKATTDQVTWSEEIVKGRSLRMIGSGNLLSISPKLHDIKDVEQPRILRLNYVSYFLIIIYFFLRWSYYYTL